MKLRASAALLCGLHDSSFGEQFAHRRIARHPPSRPCLNNFFLPKAKSRYAGSSELIRLLNYATYVRAIVKHQDNA